MIDAPLAYAFGVGMVAAFNPCGFAMLPAYVSYFLGLEADREPDERSDVFRALAVGGAMTAGFLVVFGLLGVVLEPTLDTVLRRLPWVTIALGLVLICAGAAMLAGRSITVPMPRIAPSSASRELWSVFLFGVSYALVSLSCTITLFVAVVSTTFDSANFISGIAVFLAYGLGMGLVLMALTLGIALARQGVVGAMRKVLPYLNQISGVLLVLAGVYVAYYGWFELRVQTGNTDGSGPADRAFALNARISNWIQQVGPVRIGLLLGLFIGLAVTVSLARRATTPADQRDSDHSRP